MATTNTAVVNWLGLRTPSQADQAILTEVVAAANAYVGGLPIVIDRQDPAADWPAGVMLGATMLAARLYRRRNSASGVEAITESGAQYVARYDSDISRMLGIDGFKRPAVG